MTGALISGRVVPFSPELARALGRDIRGALALQQLHYLGRGAEDGWVPMSYDTLAAEIVCSRDEAGATLKALEVDGLVESRPGRGRRPTSYRVDRRALGELLPPGVVSDTSTQGSERVASDISTEESVASDISTQNTQVEVDDPTQVVSDISTHTPDVEQDSGSALSRARARGEENRTDRNAEDEELEDSPTTKNDNDSNFPPAWWDDDPSDFPPGDPDEEIPF